MEVIPGTGIAYFGWFGQVAQKRETGSIESEGISEWIWVVSGQKR